MKKGYRIATRYGSDKNRAARKSWCVSLDSSLDIDKANAHIGVLSRARPPPYRARAHQMLNSGSPTAASLDPVRRGKAKPSFRRVGAHLAVSAPPGTVRAPLDAYGSTSETAKRYIFQRGQFRVAPEPGEQGGLSPPESQAKVVPVLVPTSICGHNVMENDF